jgi:hypothetical protein
MVLRGLLAGSLVLACLGAGLPWANAFDDSSEMGLRLRPNTTSQPVQTAMMNQPTVNEEVPLRGHLSTIPKGTMMMIRLDQTLSSSANKVGDPVSAVLEADVYLENMIAIPAGSEGSVTSVTPAANMGKAGSMEVQFYTLKTTNGMSIPMQARIVTADNSGVIKGDSEQAQVLKTLGTAVGSAGAGTLMGAAAGSILGSAGAGATFGRKSCRDWLCHCSGRQTGSDSKWCQNEHYSGSACCNQLGILPIAELGITES